MTLSPASSPCSTLCATTRSPWAQERLEASEQRSSIRPGGWPRTWPTVCRTQAGGKPTPSRFCQRHWPRGARTKPWWGHLAAQWLESVRPLSLDYALAAPWSHVSPKTRPCLALNPAQTVGSCSQSLATSGSPGARGELAASSLIGHKVKGAATIGKPWRLLSSVGRRGSGAGEGPARSRRVKLGPRRSAWEAGILPLGCAASRASFLGLPTLINQPLRSPQLSSALCWLGLWFAPSIPAIFA